MAGKPQSDIPRNQRPATPCPKCSGPRDRLPSGWMRCPECDRTKTKDYHSRNREKHKERVKEYYQNNKEVYKRNALKNYEIIKQRNRDWLAKNREQERARLKKYAEENKEHVAQRNKEWRKNNPDKVAAIYQKRKENEHPLYATWRGIIERCYNPNHHAFPDWGGRGIGVNERWWIFANFVEDVWPRPSMMHTIDRYPDMFGDYGPDNWRWATKTEQNRNRKNTLYVDYNDTGEIISLSEAADRDGVSYLSAKNKYKLKTSKRMLTTWEGKQIKVEQLSKETGINEQVLLHRARTSTNVEYLTSRHRSIQTHEYKGWWYTLLEIAFMENVDVRSLRPKMLKEKKSLKEALIACFEENKENRDR
jgi:hypothetical protein